MDLGAYANIESLEELAEKNHIVVPRLRGYRLMKDENPVDSRLLFQDNIATITECVIRSDFVINANISEYSTRTDRAVNKYIKDGKTRWDLLHGKKRKAVKYTLKGFFQGIKAQCDMWNKYCGREDVLYIHARIGGFNWNYYHGDELRKEPWFLDKVDDAFDFTYCDIYAKIEF